MDVQLRPWDQGDQDLLVRLMGNPAMMEHLGGPETLDQIHKRHQRYCQLEPDKESMLVILAGPEKVPAGSIGYWEKEWHGQTVWETGWSVLPEFQGHGIASKAARLVIVEVQKAGRHSLLYAYPSIENLASNAICRKLGFTLEGEEYYEYPPGHMMACNCWRLLI